MEKRTLTAQRIASYGSWLRAEERTAGTVEKYLRSVRAFAAWLDGKPVAKEAVTEWKERLQAKGCAPSTVNCTLAALNGMFRLFGWDNCRAKFVKVQRRLFRDASRDMTRGDYSALIASAHRLGRERLALLMEAICATGIRVSELKYITVEAAERGRSEISLKGKIRTILLPERLCRKLLQYARKNKTASGEVFLTKSGKPLSRRQIWAEMKAICQYAGVVPDKVFPHNLRHLFATTFYRACGDIAKLADVLGHSSIETTRIYLLTPGTEHRKTLDRLGLIT